MNQQIRPFALVTGAAQGIGRATTERLVKDGYFVVAIDKNESAMTWIKGLGAVEAMVVDVSNLESVKTACNAIAMNFGPPQVVVNNAGIGGPFHNIDEVSDDEWELIVHTNLRSVFLFARWALPLMKQQQYGRIVNISSIQGRFGAKRSSTYSASKHGVIGYTRNIAAEWGPFGITSNAICPGYIETTLGVQDDKIDGHSKRVIARTPTGKVGFPEDVADLVSYLVKPNSSYINGSIINIDGGISADVGI